MKKTVAALLIACMLALTCSAFGDDLIAEIFPSETEVYYGFGSGTKLDVPTYGDGTHVYVSLEAFMQALGGTYEAADGLQSISSPAPLIGRRGFFYFSLIRKN